MKENAVMDLKEIILETLKENPTLFERKKEKNSWCDSRRFFLNTNQLFLTKVKQKLEEKGKKKISVEDLFFMQKFFLIYSKDLPKKLLSLSWNKIKMILNLCESEKRNFYIELCTRKNVSETQLVQYIVNDVYEKFLVMKKEMKAQSTQNFNDFLEQILQIYSVVWE